jgi:hypothetical protein
MNRQQRDEWNNREMVVTIKTHCEHCKTLQPNVEPRSWNNGSWSNRRTVNITSCDPCFLKAIEEEKSKSSSDYAGLY